MSGKWLPGEVAQKELPKRSCPNGAAQKGLPKTQEELPKNQIELPKTHKSCPKPTRAAQTPSELPKPQMSCPKKKNPEGLRALRGLSNQRKGFPTGSPSDAARTIHAPPPPLARSRPLARSWRAERPGNFGKSASWQRQCPLLTSRAAHHTQAETLCQSKARGSVGNKWTCPLLEQMNCPLSRSGFHPCPSARIRAQPCHRKRPVGLTEAARRRSCRSQVGSGRAADR